MNSYMKNSLKLASSISRLNNLRSSSIKGLQFSRFLTTASNVNAEKEPALKLSDNCIKRLKDLSKSSPEKSLRVTVDSGGCSGFEYKFLLDTHLDKKEDIIIEKEGCKVLIDKESVDFLKGATLDYYEELIRTGFRIIGNPNSEQNCSCGTSFSIKI